MGDLGDRCMNEPWAHRFTFRNGDGEADVWEAIASAVRRGCAWVQTSNPTDVQVSVLTGAGFFQATAAPDEHIWVRRLPARRLGAINGTVTRERTRRSAYVWVAKPGDEASIAVVRNSMRTLSPGWWALPGGGVEGDEQLTDAARREAAEETGLDVEIVDNPLTQLRSWIEWDHPRHGRERLWFDQHVFPARTTELSMRAETDGSSNAAEWVSVHSMHERMSSPVMASAMWASGFHGQALVAARRSTVPELGLDWYGDDARTRLNGTSIDREALLCVLSKDEAWWWCADLDIESDQFHITWKVRSRDGEAIVTERVSHNGGRIREHSVVT
jgi:8-oxo-dGTP pyrophosphatase MutT (NUDIX family)